MKLKTPWTKLYLRRALERSLEVAPAVNARTLMLRLSRATPAWHSFVKSSSGYRLPRAPSFDSAHLSWQSILSTHPIHTNEQYARPTKGEQGAAGNRWGGCRCHAIFQLQHHSC